jgi:hypothetical protein
VCVRNDHNLFSGGDSHIGLCEINRSTAQCSDFRCETSAWHVTPSCPTKPSCLRQSTGCLPGFDHIIMFNCLLFLNSVRSIQQLEIDAHWQAHQLVCHGGHAVASRPGGARRFRPMSLKVDATFGLTGSSMTSSFPTIRSTSRCD